MVEDNNTSLLASIGNAVAILLQTRALATGKQQLPPLQG